MCCKTFNVKLEIDVLKYYKNYFFELFYCLIIIKSNAQCKYSWEYHFKHTARINNGHKFLLTRKFNGMIATGILFYFYLRSSRSESAFSSSTTSKSSAARFFSHSSSSERKIMFYKEKSSEKLLVAVWIFWSNIYAEKMSPLI